MNFSYLDDSSVSNQNIMFHYYPDDHYEYCKIAMLFAILIAPPHISTHAFYNLVCM